ncbi:MAG TPA: PD-(D/E)XK nuclease family protein [Paucimonas sp.]|nr:PD-(D/E)XK nuclease family protein [Paucimonas sp.]
MLHSPVPIKPCAVFWDEVARIVQRSELLSADGRPCTRDFSAVRILVPTMAHVQQLRTAFAARMAEAPAGIPASPPAGVFIPPRITTLGAWLALQPPVKPAGDAERLMSLYAVLRQQAWLKKLFSARRNTDLLPLARTLLTLCDELTQALFPLLRSVPDAADERWQAALAHMSPAARELLSDETQMVWSIWKSLLDERDPHVVRFAQLQRLAEQADEALVWVSPVAPDPFEEAFLAAYAGRRPVLPITLDWRGRTLESIYLQAWPDLAEDGALPDGPLAAPASLRLSEARNLEDEAIRGAQTVLDWLAAGKSRVAVVAQDRVVARRIRALLERARVGVADETGWKLSTTRAAAALAAWFETVASRADTTALLDFLKSPFVLADIDDKPDHVMVAELALRRSNVGGGWERIDAALTDYPVEREVAARLARQAEKFAGQRKSLAQWVETTLQAVDALAMRAELEADHAGAQVLALFETIARDCAALELPFSFAEWRAFVNLQFESAPFAPAEADKRVVMLPLNGAHLRGFDAVLMIGADADHLPSRPVETLFFANAVRRELGLATRESRQRQQLRDFAELLLTNPVVVVSWQAHKGGEPNPVSPWIARLQMALERAGAAPLAQHAVHPQPVRLTPEPVARPAPAAPELLPAKLSASGYNSFVACPYQFFATRMLGVSAIDDLSDLPEKRDYGDWLHEILRQYHDTLRERNLGFDGRCDLMAEISERIFERELAKSAAALGYYARWKKTMPAYVAWADERERQGWRFEIGEAWRERRLSWPGGEVTLHGRIDRIDGNDAGERAVLDYKTKNMTALRDRFKRLEDHQLAFYGLLSEEPPVAAHYVALEPAKDRIGDAAAPDYPRWQQALQERIERGMQAISQGAALPANGIETACRYCDVRGLCRKGAW